MTALALIGVLLMAQPEPIDRQALVTRHNIAWNDAAGQIPLGNGELCFNADGTGLQTFGGVTMAHWAWHSSPLPAGCTPADVPETGTVETGRLTGPMKRAAARPDLNGWMFRNPHPANLARLRLLRPDGSPLAAAEVSGLERTYDLWRGLHRSQFVVDGQPVTVETVVHPRLDAVALRLDSPLLRSGRLVVALDFPYPGPDSSTPWAGDWQAVQAHTSELVLRYGERRADLLRRADDLTYRVRLAWSAGAGFSRWPAAGARRKLTVVAARWGNGQSWVDVTDKLAASVREDRLALTPNYPDLGDPLPGRPKVLQLSYTLDGERHETEVGEGRPLVLQAERWDHAFRLTGAADGPLELVCAFAGGTLPDLPSASATEVAAAEHWRDFWSTGGAIDLSGSRDPRWRELERRIVLSQYQMAAQSAGSWPSAEDGLMGLDAWYGQFHMEMVWWHLAHYGLWGRWDQGARAIACYQRFLPMARKLAAQFGYRGAKWGKQVGPEGRTAPWSGSFVLSWQQPHPIFFAELDYRQDPTSATLARWREVVLDTAEYMADFPTRDEQGVYHLQPIMPPSEQGFTRDTVFDLAYWRWGLDTAQRWRARLGLPREPRWDDVRAHLAPLPTDDGLFVHSADWHDTYTKRNWEHPDPVGVLGMLSPTEGVDAETAHRTVVKVASTWQWERCWGWDFPWMAMACARVGEPKLAVDALLREAGSRNHYDQRGVNTGGPCPYLPGNGGLLYAAAMMAAGWDGAPQRPAPGFPDDGSWVVRSEGLRPAP